MLWLIWHRSITRGCEWQTSMPGVKLPVDANPEHLGWHGVHLYYSSLDSDMYYIVESCTLSVRVQWSARVSAFSARRSSSSNRTRCVIYEVILDNGRMTGHLLQTPKPDTLILSNVTRQMWSVWYGFIWLSKTYYIFIMSNVLRTFVHGLIILNNEKLFILAYADDIAQTAASK